MEFFDKFFDKFFDRDREPLEMYGYVIEPFVLNSEDPKFITLNWKTNKYLKPLILSIGMHYLQMPKRYLPRGASIEDNLYLIL